ncbi:MAG: glycosyltransferase [Microcoleaceae cyanobacterium]
MTLSWNILPLSKYQSQNNLNSPRICQVVASINEYTGGPALTVTSLAETLAKNGVESHLLTLDYPQYGQQVIASNVHLHSFQANQLTRSIRGFHIDAHYTLDALASTGLDLIHNHGLWMFPNFYARQSALKHNLPLVISTHGMLNSWSLRFRHLKKRVAWLFYEYNNLSNAVLFHATSFEELLAIRQLGFSQPIAVIPNGVCVYDHSLILERSILTQTFPKLKNKKWLLFLSRVHPKKGLENLLAVWKLVGPLFKDWHLVIAGPSAVDYLEKLKKLTVEFEIEQQVTFTGMLTGQLKQAALANADLFVLPTYSENFGVAIAEALAYKVPVITTQGAPWQELLTYECGWWIKNTQQELSIALTEAMKMSHQDRRLMGVRGRELVISKYSLDLVGREMLNVYRWILSDSDRPDCVYL